LFYSPKIAGDGKVPFAHTRRLNQNSLERLQARQIGPDFFVEAYPRTPDH
jgi:riboflavin biosynthesis pyrimidine reductase